MSVILNTNYGAVVSSKNLADNERAMNRVVERISSGKKTIHARDDAAGVAIAGRMESQIRGLTTAIQHAKEGKSLATTTEGSLQEITDVLQKMRELAVHSASGTANNSDKGYLNLEMSNLVSQIESISLNSSLNGNQLLRGEQFTFFTDMDVSGANITTISADMAVTTLGVPIATVNIGAGVNQSDLDDVVSAIDSAIKLVSTKRADLGAVSNRFDHIIGNLQTVINNTVRSKGVMINADYAIETTQLTRNTILQQAATSMVAQANASKGVLLALIQG